MYLVQDILFALWFVSHGHLYHDVCKHFKPLLFSGHGYDFRWNTSVYTKVKGEYSTVSY